MHTYKVTMQELGPDGKIRTLETTAFCEDRSDVIKFYGLNQPDIIDYDIEEVE